MKNIYKGFSSKNYQRNKSFVLTDVELVKRDILNHIFTRRGERVKMAAFGTNIQDIVFEPNNEITQQTITEDFQTVFKYDPRVELLSLNVMSLPEQHAILVIAEIKYIELNLYGRMDVTIDTSA